MAKINAYSITEFKFCPYVAYYLGDNCAWNGKDRCILDNLYYSAFVNGEHYHLMVPKGFVTDLGSVPGYLKGLVDDNDQSILAFILHDYLFKRNCPYDFDRATTDKILRSIIRDDGQSRYHASKTWLGVFIGRTPYIGVKYRVDNIIIDEDYRKEVLNHANAAK